MLIQYVTFNETSLLKSTVSQQVERTKTKDVSQRVDVDATPPPPVGSVSVRISPDVTPGEIVASFDVEQVEDIDENVEWFKATGIKIKLRKWVKNYESQACDRDKLKLKVVVLHDGSKEIHMTQPDRFTAEDSVTSAWAWWSSFQWTTINLIPWARYVGNRKGAAIWWCNPYEAVLGSREADWDFT